MSKALLWFYLSCKRCLKKLPFLLILLLLPAGGAAVSQTAGQAETNISIAVFVRDAGSNDLGLRLADHLTGSTRDGGMFKFYLCESEQQLMDDVASRQAECGYVIYEDFMEKLDRKSLKRTIGVCSAPSTVLASLSAETVMAALMEIYDRDLLQAYVSENPLFAPIGPSDSPAREEAVQKSGELYDKWQSSRSTFHFDYKYAGQTAGSEAGLQDTASVIPIRGIASVLIFITGLYGASALCTDEKKGLFLPLSYHLRTPCKIASLAGPVMLSAIFALLALTTGNCFTSPVRELSAMAGYIIIVTVFAWLLHLICKKAGTVCCLIPFFVIGSLLFTPVFIDAGRFIPAIDTAAKFFPPYYYLRLFVS